VRSSPGCCILVLHDADRNGQHRTEAGSVTSNADDVLSATLSKIFDAMLPTARLKIARLHPTPTCLESHYLSRHRDEPHCAGSYSALSELKNATGIWHRQFLKRSIALQSLLLPMGIICAFCLIWPESITPA